MSPGAIPPIPPGIAGADLVAALNDRLRRINVALQTAGTLPVPTAAPDLSGYELVHTPRQAVAAPWLCSPTGTHVFGTVYHNTGAYPVRVVVSAILPGTACQVIAFSDATSTPTTELATVEPNATSSGLFCLAFDVLPGNYYKITATGTPTLPTAAYWVETEW